MPLAGPQLPHTAGRMTPATPPTAGPTSEPEARGKGRHMFFFFNNRMGCLPSLLLSAVVTVVLLLLTGALR